MQVTVNDVMHLRVMKEARIVAGHSGGEHVVEYVDVLESSEGYQWLRKNTLLITTLLPILHDEQAQRLFIEHLHSVQVAAVAIKPKRFIDSIPTFMLEDAERYQIPIIELPYHAVYCDLVSKCSQLIINSQASIMQETLAISQMFTEVVQNGGGLEEIAATLSLNVNRPVIIEDRDFNLITYACGDAQLKKNIQQVLADNRQIKSILKKQQPITLTEQKTIHLYNHDRSAKFALAPIIFNNNGAGYITLAGNGEEISELNDIALENAATVAALIMATIQSNQEKEAMIHYGILTDLIFGNTYTQENISAWLDYFGWEQEACYAASILKIFPIAGSHSGANKKDMKQSLFRVFSKLVQETLDNVFIIPQTQTMILIHALQQDMDHFRDEMQACYDKLCAGLAEYALQIKFHLCIGLPQRSLMDISASYRQALTAMEISTRLQNYIHNNSTFFYDDLDIYHIFIKYPDKQDLYNFSHSYLDPLLDSKKLKFDALETLEAYIASGCSINKCAQKLYLHVNTIKYRVNKIKEVLHNPLSDHVYLYKLYMALCMCQIIKE